MYLEPHLICLVVMIGGLLYTSYNYPSIAFSIPFVGAGILLTIIIGVSGYRRIMREEKLCRCRK